MSFRLISHNKIIYYIHLFWRGKIRNKYLKFILYIHFYKNICRFLIHLTQSFLLLLIIIIIIISQVFLRFLDGDRIRNPLVMGTSCVRHTNPLHLIGIQNRNLIQNADKYSIWWQWLIFAGWRSDCQFDIHMHDAVLGIELLRFDSPERQSSDRL